MAEGETVKWWRGRRQGSRGSMQPVQSGPATYREKPEVKSYTQGVGQRPRGLGAAEIAGMAGAAATLEAAAAGPVLDRSLHAVGQVCPRCGRAFTENDAVRRITSGELVHDVC